MFGFLWVFHFWGTVPSAVPLRAPLFAEMQHSNQLDMEQLKIGGKVEQFEAKVEQFGQKSVPGVASPLWDVIVKV